MADLVSPDLGNLAVADVVVVVVVAVVVVVVVVAVVSAWPEPGEAVVLTEV